MLYSSTMSRRGPISWLVRTARPCSPVAQKLLSSFLTAVTLELPQVCLKSGAQSSSATPDILDLPNSTGQQPKSGMCCLN